MITCFCLRFYYYTAGTGGVGPSLLASSILVLGEEAITYSKGDSKGKYTIMCYCI